MLAEKLSGSGAAAKTYIEDVFSTYLYTGNGSTQTITNGIGGDRLTWIKRRDAPASNLLIDTIRGATKRVSSDAVSAEVTEANGLTAFTSDGFSLGTTSAYNASSGLFASLTFRKAAKFLDFGTYVGNGSNRLIPHALGVAPGMVLVKDLNTTNGFRVYHGSLANSQYLQLGGTQVVNTDATLWNSTTATATDFSIGTNSAVNTVGDNYVWYAFAHDISIDGLIQCGSFTTDSSGNATVNLGWEPQYLMVKRTDAAGDWNTLDTMRGFIVDSGSGSTGDVLLRANATTAEIATYGLNPTATGFVSNGWGTSSSFVYLAIRRGPMKKPTSGTQVYQAIARTGTGAAATVAGVGFPPDLMLSSMRNIAGYGTTVYDRLRGATKQLYTSVTMAEYTNSASLTSFTMDGITLGADNDGTDPNYVNASGFTYIYSFFRRYPGVFDQVCYDGTGVARTVAHNLGVVPELMIVKARNTTSTTWWVFFGDNTKGIALNDTAPTTTLAQLWNNTSPTASAFTVGSANTVNGSGYTLVADLFATLPGISKVGSYVADGSTQTINCGFAAGARFVLIKRAIGGSGNWFIYDTVRGIVAANDPYLSLNVTDAEVTTTDWIDPASVGFAISNVAGNELNNSGSTYIYLAFA